MKTSIRENVFAGVAHWQLTALSKETLVATTFVASFITWVLVSLLYVTVQFRINDMYNEWIDLQEKVQLSGSYYQELLLEEQKLNQYDRVRLLVGKKLGLITPSLKHYADHS